VGFRFIQIAGRPAVAKLKHNYSLEELYFWTTPKSLLDCGIVAAYGRPVGPFFYKAIDHPIKLKKNYIVAPCIMMAAISWHLFVYLQ
jgi:hypothetical protein